MDLWHENGSVVVYVIKNSAFCRLVLPRWVMAAFAAVLEQAWNVFSSPSSKNRAGTHEACR